jgi:hypothetical protein
MFYRPMVSRRYSEKHEKKLVQSSHPELYVPICVLLLKKQRVFRGEFYGATRRIRNLKSVCFASLQ